MKRYALKDKKKQARIEADWQIVPIHDAITGYILLHPDWREKKAFTIYSGYDGDRGYRIKPEEVEEVDE